MLPNKNSPGLLRNFSFSSQCGVPNTVVIPFNIYKPYLPEPCIYSFICIVKHTPKQMYCTKAVSSDEFKNGCITFDDKFEMYDL